MNSPNSDSSSSSDNGPAKNKKRPRSSSTSEDDGMVSKTPKNTSGNGDHDASPSVDISCVTLEFSTVSPEPETSYSPELLNFMRLIATNIEVVTNVFHFVFEKGSKDRYQEEKLLEYYSRKGADMRQFEDSKSCSCRNKHKIFISSTQLDMIEDDPKGETFDITLLYHCLRNGKHGLAKGNDSKWEGVVSLEFSLTELKEKRNKLAHATRKNVYSYSDSKLASEKKNLYEHLTRILECTESLYKIAPEIVQTKVCDMNTKIDELLDADLKKLLEKYKKDSLFLKLGEFVNIDGKEEIINQYDFGKYTNAAPVTHLKPNKERKVKVGKEIHVKKIFTDMELKNTSDESKIITYAEILQDKSDSKPIILIEGIAGVGKTTLLKKILNDWIRNEGTMEDLKKYDLLLYAECRNSAISSFKDLLEHLMPKTLSRNFNNRDDMKTVVLDQKILVILDGLDEVNASSTDLFKEVLELNMKFRVMVVVTTRPEKLPFFEDHVKHLEKKHIKLLGLSKEKRYEFVCKYYNDFVGDSNETDIDELINYLKRNADRLEELWKLPYNLAFLTILWINDNKSLSNIETASQLYKEINKLYRTKLKRRLQSCKNTQALHDSEIETKINSFLYSLAEESLLGLKNDNIVCVTHEAYQRLNKVCRQIDVPIEEMIGAFLMKVFSNSREAYRFPHKALQEYQAAQCICMLLTGDYESSSIQKIMNEIYVVLTNNSLSKSHKQRILDVTETELKRKRLQPTESEPRQSLILDILKEIGGASDDIELPKFQNVLIQLIGMFYLEEYKIKNDVKKDALNLLKQSGLNDPDAWLNIMNEVKCDKFVTSFICKQPGILKGDITIRDAVLFAYTSLMETLEQPRNVNIKINLNDEMSNPEELFVQINKGKFNVVEVDLRCDFRRRLPSDRRRLENSLNQIFERCPVKRYMGKVTPGLVLPVSLQVLSASLADASCYQVMQSFLNSDKQQLVELHVCVRPNIIPQDMLRPLPGTLLSSLYMADIQDMTDVIQAILIAKKLLPTTGKKKWFEGIYFPRLALSVAVKDILERMAMEGIEVFNVIFPSSSRPTKTDKEEGLDQLRRNIRGSPRLLWGQIKDIVGSENIDDW